MNTNRLALLTCCAWFAASPVTAKTHNSATHTPGGGAAHTQGGASDDKGTATAMPSGPPPTPDSPTADKSTPPPPTLPDMTAFVLMDANTGDILGEAAPELQVAPASLTKLMTAHITYQALHTGKLQPGQVVPISVEAWHAGGSRMFIDTTSHVTVDELLHGLIITSGNDAAVALAEQIAGTTDAFVTMMNTQAAAMHLANTNYTNPTGLPDPALHTTAMDVAILSRNILKDEPEILQISKQQNYTYDNITQASWNPVLQHDPTVDGLKTGLTQASGHCIDATAIRGNMRLIAVVMGGPTWHDSTAAIEALLDYGQKFFTEDTLASAGQTLGTLTSHDLDAGSVPATVAADLIATVPVDATKKITATPSFDADASKGIKKGQTLGTISYALDGKTIASAPLVALNDAPPASWTTKLKRMIAKIL